MVGTFTRITGVALPLLLGLALSRGGWSGGGRPAEEEARRLCGGPPDRISVAGACASCDLTRLEQIVRAYHPANVHALGAVQTAQRGVSSPIDVGSEKAWSPVQLENSTLMNRAFGDQRCPAAVARFGMGTARVSFVAVDHVSQSPSERPAVFGAIRREFEVSAPAGVVVEGYPEEFPCSEAVRIYLTPETDLTSEPEYLAKLALTQGKIVRGGEPDDIGLRSPDRQGYLFLRELTTLRPPQPLVQAERPEIEQQAFNRVLKMFPEAERWTYRAFLDWYREKNGRDFRLENSLVDITPSFDLPSSAVVRATNRMTDEIDLRRDRHVLSVVRRSLLLGGPVEVAYGRDHFPRQLPVYESIFGHTAGPVAKCNPSPPNPNGSCLR